MNPESTPVTQVGATADSAEAPVTHDAASPVTNDAAATTAPSTPTVAAMSTAQEPTAPVPAPVRPPGSTLRLTFKLRLEDASEVLLDLDDALDFRHGPYKRSVATVGDQVRKVFEAIVAEPLLTTVNQYVRLKLEAGQSPSVVEKPAAPSFPPFPSPSVAAPDGHPFGGPDHP